MTAARDVVDGLQQVLTLYYRDSGIVIQHVEDPLQHTGSHIQHTIKVYTTGKINSPLVENAISSLCLLS